MTQKGFLEILEDICRKIGVPTNYGCSENDIGAYKRIAKREHPGSPICVVSDWKWLEVRADEFFPEQFDTTEEGYFHYLVAATILEDEADRGLSGVVTSRLIDFSHNCLFRTRNTTYLLVSSGFRMRMPPLAIASGLFPLP